MPSDVFCTHVVFYVVGAKFMHLVQLTRSTLDNLPNIDMFTLDLGGSRPTETEAAELERIHTNLQLLQHPNFVPICSESCRMLRENEGVFMSDPPTVQALRDCAVGTMNRRPEADLSKNYTFMTKKMLTLRMEPAEGPMIRIGTINLEDPISVANLFGLPKSAVQDQQLYGHIVIEVQSSGSRPTEAGPKPHIVSAPTMSRR